MVAVLPSGAGGADQQMPTTSTLWSSIVGPWRAAGSMRADTIGWAIIENATRAAPESLKDQPLAEAAVLHGLSRVYSLLDRNDRAEPLCRRAHELRLRELGTSDPMTIESLVWLSTVLVNQGKLDEAQDLCRHASAVAEAKARLAALPAREDGRAPECR